MSDKTFQWSFIGLMVLVVLWIILGIVFGITGWFLVVLAGLLVAIGSGLMLPYAGKRYTAVLTAIVWIILGILYVFLGQIGWFWVVLLGLVVAIVGGGFLLDYWGKSYVARE